MQGFLSARSDSFLLAFSGVFMYNQCKGVIPMYTRIGAMLLCVSLLAALLQGCNALKPTQPATVPESTTTAPVTTQPTTAPQTTEPETTVPVTTVPPTTQAPTTLPATTVPPVTAAPTTQPVNTGEMIGSLYTRGQLMAMENVRKDYGHGSLTPGVRPNNPINCQAAYGQYGGNFIGPDDNRVYLTFDCGYEHTVNGIRVTEMILDALKEKDAKAVFFVTDYYCHQSPDLIRRMIDEGHAVGNHTSNHPVMPGQSIDKMVYEVTSLHNYVLENFGYTMKLFRPPTGAYSTRSLAVVQSLGYKTVNWSFAHVDWDPANQPANETALTRVVNGAHNGTIYLLHAVSLTNAQILGEAIDQIRGLGYEFALFE